MRAVLIRSGPLLVFFAWLVAGVVLLLLANGPFAPADPWVLEYEPVEKLGLWCIGTAGAAGVGSAAIRLRSRACRIVGLTFTAVWVLVGGALLADIVYAVAGPGIETVGNCGSGMDCIGKPRPAAPLLGAAELVVLWLVLTTPPVLLGLIVHAVRRPAPPTELAISAPGG